MTRVKTSPWPFDVPPSAAVITTSHVTLRRMPILYVTHDLDEEEGASWQFHCGNGDYRPSVLQLVRLEEILERDPGLIRLAGLPVGHHARRTATSAPWVSEKQP